MHQLLVNYYISYWACEYHYYILIVYINCSACDFSPPHSMALCHALPIIILYAYSLQGSYI